MEKRDSFIDIMKAIGIISIVIGHSVWILPRGFQIGPFVYSYHIMIFLFVAGFCFKKEYAEQPWMYVGKRLTKLMPLYVGYNTLFVILHNFLRNIHIITWETEKYTKHELLSHGLQAFTFSTNESMLGAFWFVPMFFFATAMFVVLFALAQRCKYSLAIHGMILFLTAGVGLYTTKVGMNLNYHLQISFLSVPIIYLGYFIKCYWETIKKYFTVFSAVICGGIVYYILLQGVGCIDLSVNAIINPILFYPITILGICFVISMAKFLDKFQYSRKAFSYIGKDSFHIMALHFFAFKFVDCIYGNYKGYNYVVFEKFPHAFSYTGVYLMVGIGLPLGLVWILRKTNKILK